MTINSCWTCQWWSDAANKGQFCLCVWHNGMRGTPNAKTDFGRTLFRTTADFGCAAWESNKRQEESRCPTGS